MERNISTFLTPRGLGGALLFVIAGFFTVYLRRPRIGALEMAVEIGTMFILMPAACLWVNRKTTLTPERRSDPE